MFLHQFIYYLKSIRMKKNISILVLFVFSLSFGQATFFSYDIAGNQIEVNVQIVMTSVNKNTSSSATLQNNPIYKDVNYYPNPVKSELYMEWRTIENNTLNSIIVFNTNGALLKEYKNLTTSNNYTLPFQDYPQGVYFVQFFYNNGEQKSFKIIKQE
jgi:hypothetical protein